MKARIWQAALLVAGCTTGLGALASCDESVNMAKQPHYAPLQPSAFFDDGGSARPIVEGAVSRSGEQFTSTPPATQVSQPPMSLALLTRGREQFDIHCAPCHGRDGYGRGMVVQRGYPAPPSYHESRLRSVTDAHLYQVITYGLGKMPVYGKDVRPADRWAIVAYLRALQLSQHAGVEDVPTAERAVLDLAPTTQKDRP
jgi:mono/diheme cytochrome c family protein